MRAVDVTDLESVPVHFSLTRAFFLFHRFSLFHVGAHPKEDLLGSGSPCFRIKKIFMSLFPYFFWGGGRNFGHSHAKSVSLA